MFNCNLCEMVLLHPTIYKKEARLRYVTQSRIQLRTKNKTNLAPRHDGMGGVSGGSALGRHAFLKNKIICKMLWLVERSGLRYVDDLIDMMER